MLDRPFTHLVTKDTSNESQLVKEGCPLPTRQQAYYETYQAYNLTIAANSPFTDAGNLVDLETDLGRKANTVLIIADVDVQMKFNSLTSDTFVLDVSVAGKSIAIGPGELLISKIYFASQIPSGSASEVKVQILAY